MFEAVKSVRAHRIQLLFVIAVSVITATAFALIWAHGFVPQVAPPSIDLLREVFQGEVSPEPTEQFVFTILAAISPIFVFVLTLLPQHTRFIAFPRATPAVSVLLPFLIAAFLFVPFVDSDFLTTVIGEYGKPHIHGIVSLAVAPVVAGICCLLFLLASRERVRRTSSRNWTTAAWGVFLLCVMSQMLAWRVVSFASATRSPVWSFHFDAVIYALSQVVAGKTLLVDLPSQYGLFPEIIGPIFKFIGLSVKKFSALFAVMQFFSLVALYYVLSQLVKLRPLLLVSGLALVMITFETVLYFVGSDERYYQYWPVRFFWPAISVYCFYCFARRRTLARSSLISVIGAIGLLWNLDSGLFITVAFGAYLVARLICECWVFHRRSLTPSSPTTWSVKTYATAIALHAAITLVVVVAFLILMSWKAHQPLKFFWMLQYQKTFYSMGFMMLPLPRKLDPWMSVLGVYLIGLISSISAWRSHLVRARDDTIFYLSMLGLGLFVYYEGRSHVLNLVTVCWPAAMIIAILADQSLRAIRLRLLPAGQLWLPIAALSILLVACSSILIRVPMLIKAVISQYSTRGAVVEPLVRSELDFIKQHSVGRHECLILSLRQGIYYAETGLASPVSGPGIIEVILKSDEKNLVDSILKGDLSCVFFGTRPGTAAGLNISMQEILSKYVIVAKNPEDSMLFLQPKP